MTTSQIKFALIALALFLFIGPPSNAQEAKAKKIKQKQTELVGFLSDCQCGESLENVKMAADHTKECCLMDACAKSGFGIYSDGKFTKFDDEGSKKAQAYLTALKKEKNLKVKVKGQLSDGKFVLAKIQDAP
jgi:hypothetical protein